MNVHSLQRAVPRLAIAAAVLAFLYDAPHLLFDANYATASDHPLYMFHAAMGIAALVVLVVVSAGLLVRADDRLRGGLPVAAGVLSLSGSVLAAGGIWGEGFMIPYLADIDPSVFADDVGGSLLAIIAAGALTLSLGWMMTSVALSRAELLSKGQATALGAGAAIAFVPLPLTTLVFFVVVAVVAQRVRTTVSTETSSRLVTA